jgi:hypothetical protein
MKRYAFHFACLLLLLAISSVALAEDPASTRADTSAVASPTATEVPPGDGGMSPLPDLMPEPTYKLKACEFYHFAATCVDCLNFCSQIENCYGVCSWQPGPWCDCNLGAD